MLQSPWGGPQSRVAANHWTGKLLKDWTLNGNTQFATGTPLTARVLGNQANSGGTGAIGSGRADATGLAIDTGGNGFFNPAAFTIPPATRFGNAGRNTIPGPSRWFLNASFGRSFPVGNDNRRRLEARLEGTNLTNHVAYTNLGTVINALNYGLPVSTMPMRSLNVNVRFRF
jgi:hypothetical protein